MKTWNIIVNARKVGAIGIFYPQNFEITTGDDVSTRDQVRDVLLEVLKLKNLEMNHIISLRERTD